MRAGALRGPLLCGLAASHDPEHAGAVVPHLGTAAAGKKTPALTVAQVRAVCAALLHQPPRDPDLIAQDITRQLRRNEQARRDHWLRRGLVAPPKRWVQ